MIFWDKMYTQEIKNSIKKVEALYNELRILQKHTTRTSEVAEFESKLDDLFDIPHATAVSTMTIEEDKQFLISQRKKGRPGFMYGIDYEQLEREQ